MTTAAAKPGSDLSQMALVSGFSFRPSFLSILFFGRLSVRPFYLSQIRHVKTGNKSQPDVIGGNCG